MQIYLSEDEEIYVRALFDTPADIFADDCKELTIYHVCKLTIIALSSGIATETIQFDHQSKYVQLESVIEIGIGWKEAE